MSSHTWYLAPVTSKRWDDGTVLEEWDDREDFVAWFPPNGKEYVLRGSIKQMREDRRVLTVNQALDVLNPAGKIRLMARILKRGM